MKTLLLEIKNSPLFHGTWLVGKWEQKTPWSAADLLITWKGKIQAGKKKAGAHGGVLGENYAFVNFLTVLLSIIL